MCLSLDDGSRVRVSVRVRVRVRVYLSLDDGSEQQQHGVAGLGRLLGGQHVLHGLPDRLHRVLGHTHTEV